MFSVVLGEICNFAAYAFAPAILVTPLGALSVLIGAVLGSYFLKEELGTLGKLGCATCLIGAIIIVLHAPPDVPIETIEQIMEYALAPGESIQRRAWRLFVQWKLTHFHRLSAVLSCGCGVCDSHDLQDCPDPRQEEPTDLPIHLLDCWICLCHVRQGVWHCRQTHLCRQQPVQARLHIRLHDFDGRVHSGTDELLQQGSGYILHADVCVS